MDILSFLPDIILLVGTTAGFVYCAASFFRAGKALFLQIVACACGCVALGQLFVVMQLITRGQMPHGFHVGILGTLGSYFFLFSGNYGQLDGLGDPKTKELRKYRLLSLLPTILVALAYVGVFLQDITVQQKVIYAVLFLLFAETSYFSCKHLILPDIEDGILKSIRPYNAAVLVLTLFNVLAVYATVLDQEIFRTIALFVCAAIYAGLGYIANRGVEKWYQ